MAKRILIIDDDVELCEETAEILASEGYFVECAFDSFKGEDKFKNNKYDIIILDFKMPGINGIEMLKKIKGNTPRPKTILISGKPFIEKITEEENISGLADCVMGKPFDIAVLLEKLKTL